MFQRAGEPVSTFYPLIGGGGGGTLQDAYNASGAPPHITTAPAKGLVFFTAAGLGTFAVAESTGTNSYIVADEDTSTVVIGDGTNITTDLSGRIASDIQFDGTSPYTISNNDDLLIQALGTGALEFTSAGNTLFSVGADFDVTAVTKCDLTGGTVDVTTTVGNILLASKGVIEFKTQGAGGETMSLVTGSVDPTSVAQTGQRGSLYMRDTGAVGELYLKQDDGSSTNWTLVELGTLQNAYDAGNTIVTAGGNDFSISGTENFFWENSATNNFKLGTGATPSVNTSGLVQVTQSIGADGVVTLKCTTVNLVGGDGREFGSFEADVTNLSDLDDTDVIYAYRADLDMQGDGPGSGLAIGAAFHANSASFTGANTYINAGLLVEDTFDVWVLSKTGAAQINYGADTEIFFMSTFNVTGGVQTDGVFNWVAKMGDVTATFLKASTIMEATGDGGDQLGGTCATFLTSSDTSDQSNPLLAGGILNSIKLDHAMDSTDAATGWHQGVTFEIQIPASGSPGGVADIGSSAVGAIINVPESYSAADGLYHNNDGTFSFGRWAFYVEAGESHLRRTEFTSVGNLGKALIRLDQNDADQPFYEIEGNYGGDPVTPDGNLCTTNLGSSVIGPLDTTWSFLGMYQVYVIDVIGTITNGRYWVPLYQAVP